MWKVELSDNSFVQGKEVTCWRKLVEKTKKENLTINRIFFNDYEILYKAERYFVVYDVFVPNIYLQNTQQIKIGIGTIRKNPGKPDRNTCKIYWFPLQGYEKLYPEIIQDIPQEYFEFSIPKTI